MVRSPLPSRDDSLDEIPLTPEKKILPEIFTTNRRVYSLDSTYVVGNHQSEIPQNDSGLFFRFFC